MEIGLIGAGAISELHVLALKKNNGTVKEIHDINKEAASKLIEQFKDITYEANLDKFLNSKKDIMAILTPPKTHYSVLKKVLDSGIKNIFCEKPLVLEKSDLNDLKKKLSDSDKFLFVGQSYRYLKHIKLMREIIRKKSENVNYFYIDYRKPIEKVRPIDGWRAEYEDYIIVDNGVHIIDLVRFLNDEDITEVDCSAKNVSGRIKGLDIASINCKLKSGAKGNIRLNHNEKDNLTPYSGEHHYFFQSYSLHLVNNKLIERKQDEEIVHLENIKEDWISTFAELWKVLLENIKNEELPEINIQNNYNTITTVIASIESARANKKIKVEGEKIGD